MAALLPVMQVSQPIPTLITAGRVCRLFKAAVSVRTMVVLLLSAPSAELTALWLTLHTVTVVHCVRLLTRQ